MNIPEPINDPMASLAPNGGSNPVKLQPDICIFTRQTSGTAALPILQSLTLSLMTPTTRLLEDSLLVSWNDRDAGHRLAVTGILTFPIQHP
jgi:hypothetical protein